MFIQTEATPNPATLKFLPGREVMASGGIDFRTADKAGRSPLAKRLFAVEGVAGVYLGGDFIAVTKTEATDWSQIKTQLLGAIMEHFMTGEPVVLEDKAGPAQTGEDSDVVRQIKELLDTRVRPAVAQDGGDIVFEGFDKGIVYLHMQGACSGCPSSTATLRHGVQNMLKHYIPEVVEVRAV